MNGIVATEKAWLVEIYTKDSTIVQTNTILYVRTGNINGNYGEKWRNGPIEGILTKQFNRAELTLRTSRSEEEMERTVAGTPAFRPPAPARRRPREGWSLRAESQPRTSWQGLPTRCATPPVLVFFA